MSKPHTQICLALLLLSCRICTGSLSTATIQQLFAEGNGYFKQANEHAAKDPDQARELFAKAAMRFERLVKEGELKNGRLYYNIGNTYFRMEDLGRAILNYRRAEAHIPQDENLHRNLAYARARCRDRIPEPEKKKILKTLFFWHYDFSLRTRSLVFISCFVAFWALASLRLLVGRTALRYPLAFIGLIALLMLGSLITDTRRARRLRPGVIISAEITTRKGDSFTYEKSFTEPLHAGTEFTLLEDRGEWLEIQLADDRTCWLPSKDVELVY